MTGIVTVSYTHLDVYKRQMFFQMKLYYLHFFFFAPFSMRNPFLPHLFTSIPILTDIKK